MKLLLIEDEKDLAQEIEIFTRQKGYVCECAYSFQGAWQKINVYEYDCIVVDITLPGGSGLDIVTKIKELSQRTGIIIISARNSVTDKITGLNLGADDYLTKPFHLAELNARIQSVLRRRQFSGETVIHYNEIEITPDSRGTAIGGAGLNLTRKEYDLLVYLLSNKDRVLTKEAIAEHIWGDKADSFDNLDFVYSQIKNLRKKMVDAGGKDYIRSVYGIGYKFTDQ
jgi:DNA-binding response OmpR family regulator